MAAKHTTSAPPTSGREAEQAPLARTEHKQRECLPLAARHDAANSLEPAGRVGRDA
jgi:hypothetical protein